MTDDRPKPKYGEYAPIGAGVPAGVPTQDPAPNPVDAAPELEAPTARRRRWDAPLTAVLMLFGVFDVVISYPRFANLASLLREVYDAQGFGTFTSDALANDMGAAMNVTRVVLLIAGIGVGLWRLGRGKLAFWVPIVAGVLAFLVVSACLLVVMLTDPALAEYAAQQATTP